MATSPELESAFDAALTQVAKCMRAGMKATGGESAAPYLQKLVEDLELERSRALERGGVDRDWFKATLKWLLEWLPETELSLIAALGRIVRAAPSSS